MQDCLSSHSSVQIDVFFFGPRQMLNLSILSKKVNHEWYIIPCGQYKYIMPGVKILYYFNPLVQTLWPKLYGANSHPSLRVSVTRKIVLDLAHLTQCGCGCRSHVTCLIYQPGKYWVRNAPIASICLKLLLLELCFLRWFQCLRMPWNKVRVVKR